MAAARRVRPRGESIVAGLAGETYSGWLFIRYLWVSEALRGKGIGRELMAGAEARALERGCHSAWVDTFSFQAPGFYPKLGYRGVRRLYEGSHPSRETFPAAKSAHHGNHWRTQLVVKPALHDFELLSSRRARNPIDQSMIPGDPP